MRSTFLVFFEMMSLASYFLVLTEQDDNAVNAGLLYFFIAHAGSVLIMIAFFIFYCYAGSFEFSAFRQTTLPAPLAFTAFYFGRKEGAIVGGLLGFSLICFGLSTVDVL